MTTPPPPPQKKKNKETTTTQYLTYSKPHLQATTRNAILVLLGLARPDGQRGGSCAGDWPFSPPFLPFAGVPELPCSDDLCQATSTAARHCSLSCSVIFMCSKGTLFPCLWLLIFYLFVTFVFNVKI